MTGKRKTMYEVLEVSPSASLQEIKAAHQRLTRSLVPGRDGLSPEARELQRQLLNLALDTLSNEVSRNAYDAKLAVGTPPAGTASKGNSNLVPQQPDARALMVVASLEAAARDKAGAKVGSILAPVTVVATAVDKSVSSLGKILKLIAWVLGLGIAIQVASLILAGQRARQPGGAISKAEEKVMLQEYYQKYGVRPASKEELDLLEIERRRKINDERAAEFEKKKQDEEYRRFVEESRRTADQVSRQLRRDEENARRQEEQEKRRMEYEKLQQQEAERNRIRAERRKLGLRGDPP